MPTCDLCWATFDTDDDLAAHVEMETMVDWPMDHAPSTYAATE